MSNRSLKPGWTWVKFGDVVRQVKDNVDPRTSGLNRYIAGEHMDTDDLRLRRWGEINGDYLGPAFHMRFKPGHVLYGSRRTYLRKVAVADFEGICANTTFVLEPQDSEVVLPELLPFIMQAETFHEFSIKNSKGSVNPYINFSDLAQYEFALPPLAEQCRMAEVLQASSAMLDSYRNLVNISDRQYLSLVLHIFQNGIQESQICEYKSFCYPAHWSLHRVDDCYELQLGKMSSATARTGENQSQYLKNNNVLWGEFDFSTLSSMSFNEVEQKKFSLEIGDLLVCEGGEIGRAAIWKNEYPGLFYQKALHRLRSQTNAYSTEFLMHYLRYCSLRGILNSIATGTTILHLPEEQLAALVLPFPPKDEQLEILNMVTTAHDATKLAKSRANQDSARHKALLRRILEVC